VSRISENVGASISTTACAGITLPLPSGRSGKKAEEVCFLTVLRCHTP
jgi:hypothetical protein